MVLAAQDLKGATIGPVVVPNVGHQPVRGVSLITLTQTYLASIKLLRGKQGDEENITILFNSNSFLYAAKNFLVFMLI